MDSNSNSSDNVYFPKIEIDSENEREVNSKMDSKHYWNSENTMTLIQALEKDCKELWDSKHPLNKDRAARQLKLEYLSGVFGTTSEEISRKVHNLRTQFNNELRKIKRRQTSTVEGGVMATSGWEYFDALCFLRAQPSDPLEDSLNLELAEFQADEEAKFGAAARANLSATSPAIWPKSVMRVAASAPPTLPPSAHPLLWPEDAVPILRPGQNVDECQIFGDFVASELRTLRSNESRKKLKRMIQKAILEVDDEEQYNNARSARMGPASKPNA